MKSIIIDEETKDMGNEVMNIEQRIKTWVIGLESEMSFWEQVLSGEIYQDKLSEWINNETFVFDELVIEYGDEVDFLDVGAGPFSNCGIISQKVKLNITAVDPLADIYNFLKKKYGIESKLKIKTGFVEMLDSVFEKDSFDIIHMSNALDHCFDPIRGLLQMLSVLRTGGKIILRHFDNEAEKNDYKGLHQWNIEKDFENNNFFIWNESSRIDIGQILAGCAEIRVLSSVSGDDTDHRVIIKKINDCETEYDSITQIMFGTVYAALLDNIYLHYHEISLLGMEDLYSRDMRMRMFRVRKDMKSRYTKEVQFFVVDIYGFGKIGKDLFMMLFDIEYNVGVIVDKSIDSRNGITILKPEEYNMQDNHILVLAIGLKEQEIVRNRYVMNGFPREKIIGIGDFLDNSFKSIMANENRAVYSDGIRF